MIRLPPGFEEHTIEAFGLRGEAWLRTLPDLLGDLGRLWNLQIGAPFELSYDAVVAVQRADGTDAVLKLGVPRAEFERGIHALRAYAGAGACQLLASDPKSAAMLLERVRPGDPLARLAAEDDDAATGIGAAVMRRLWHTSFDPSLFRPISEWFNGAFARYRADHPDGGPFPAHVLERADHVASDLVASTEHEVLLHGDLHQDNILSGTRESWLAIDPKGMRGDPGYEVGPFVLGPDPHSAKPAKLVDRRLRILADELDYERPRLRDWAFAHAVMSASWSLEDHGRDWEGALMTAQTLLDQ